mgnify:FL=1
MCNQLNTKSKLTYEAKHCGTDVFTACKMFDCRWQNLDPALVSSLLGSPIPYVSKYKVTILKFEMHEGDMSRPADKLVIV